MPKLSYKESNRGRSARRTHSCEVLRPAIFSAILAIQKHLVDAVTGPLHKLQHVEGLARKELAIVRWLPARRHEVIEVALLHAEQPGHPKQIVPHDLGASEAVVVAKGDGREVHERAVHFIQDGNVRIAIVVHHRPGHLVQEDGQGGEERSSPEQASDGDSTGQKDVAQAMKGAVGSEHGDVGRPGLIVFFGGAHSCV